MYKIVFMNEIVEKKDASARWGTLGPNEYAREISLNYIHESTQTDRIVHKLCPK
jgi:hypothetical protein